MGRFGLNSKVSLTVLLFLLFLMVVILLNSFFIFHSRLTHV